MSGLTMTELMKRRARLDEERQEAEVAWLSAAEALETLAA